MRGSLFNAILTELLGLLCPSDFAEHTALLCASSIRAIPACHQSCPGFFFQIVMLTSSAAGLKSLPSWRAAGLIKKNDFLYRVLLATKTAKSYGKKNGLRINICKGLIPEPGHQCQPDWSNSLRP
jgi:hypothetical protein